MRFVSNLMSSSQGRRKRQSERTCNPPKGFVTYKSLPGDLAEFVDHITVPVIASAQHWFCTYNCLIRNLVNLAVKNLPVPVENFPKYPLHVTVLDSLIRCVNITLLIRSLPITAG